MTGICLGAKVVIMVDENGSTSIDEWRLLEGQDRFIPWSLLLLLLLLLLLYRLCIVAVPPRL